MKTIFRFVAITVYLSLLILEAGCSDRYESHYATLSAATKDGAVDRGWIPDLLNVNASEIRELHNLDTNEVWGACQFPKSEKPFTSDVPEAAAADVVQANVFFRSPRIGWWPEALDAPLDIDQLSRAGFKMFTDPEKEFFFAINESEGKGYFGAIGRQ